MNEREPRPKSKSAGSRKPPPPPRRTSVGLAGDGDDSGKKGRATITKVASGEGRFIRNSGGRSQYGHVIVRIEPNGRGKGIEIVSDVASSAIPSKLAEAAREGVRVALDGGMVIGHPAVDNRPVVDVVVRVVGGSAHETDSTDLAFKLAGIFAIKDAVKKADPIGID